jgi:hypothetical protein
MEENMKEVQTPQTMEEHKHLLGQRVGIRNMNP